MYDPAKTGIESIALGGREGLGVAAGWVGWAGGAPLS